MKKNESWVLVVVVVLLLLFLFGGSGMIGWGGYGGHDGRLQRFWLWMDFYDFALGISNNCSCTWNNVADETIATTSTFVK